ncbi:MAG: helix-turn-helix transcriptional regulator [Bacteroidaceae bacterium]|nr:transcriptional regulator [Bacteroidota bacterium]MBR5920683.1 helix-turn-helix transcriptional regulator [Bacteroidales bacterium]MBR6482757.1 helix-turn-helix transcriptional regulator [Bacteroidaceae bacterium]
MANKKEIQSATFPDCPVRNVISRITDKWSLLVLYTLEHQEVMRFNDLWRQIPDISQKMLTTTLRHLEDDGIVSREVFVEVPPRVEYRLAERGKSLMPLLDSLLTWGIEHFSDIITDRKNHSKSNQ